MVIKMTFSLAYCIYVPSLPYYYYPTNAKDLKRIYAKFKLGHNS